MDMDQILQNIAGTFHLPAGLSLGKTGKRRPKFLNCDTRVDRNGSFPILLEKEAFCSIQFKA